MKAITLKLLFAALSMAALLTMPFRAHAATYAIEIQIDLTTSIGADSTINIFYGVVDSIALRSEARVVGGLVLPTATPGLWKSLMIQAVIDDAATAGYTLTAANVRWITLEPGDYKYAQHAATWTKDVTKTNVPTTYTNAYLGNGGEAQLVDFSGYRQYRFVVQVNKIGTGTQTAAVQDIANAANVIEVADTAAAAEHSLDSGWLDLPAWASGEQIIKPAVKSTVATDDPVYRQFALYLR